MTAAQIFTGIALITGIAVACQVVAHKLRLPALLFLLPAGFLAGIAFDPVNPIAIFGEAFSPLVNVTVAVILFSGGIELSEAPLPRHDRRIMIRLIWLGALITWAAGSLAAHYLLGLPAPIAILLGAILIVSGPTVVGPLLAYVRPQPRVRRILAWEGTVIDPVGALVAVCVFQAVRAATQPTVGQGLLHFSASVLTGLLFAAVGAALIWLGLRLTGDNGLLGTEVLIGSVVLAAGLANAVSDDAGLVTGVVMGLVTPLLNSRPLAEIRPFFDTLVSLSIGVLFVAISSLVSPASLAGVLLPGLGVAAVLILIARPVGVLLATARTTLPPRERAFIAWVAPRGIVAASTAASFSTGLDVPGSDELLPATFVVIAATVGLYSLTAVPVADLLRIRVTDEPSRPAADGSRAGRSSGS